MFTRISELLQMIQKFVIDQDESITYKAKECDEMLKAKILQFAVEGGKELQDVLGLSLTAVTENFENDNLNIKNWCLGWLGFFLNIDMKLHKQYGKIVISLIQFLQDSKNSEISLIAKRLLEQSLVKFALSDLFDDVEFSVDFLNKMLWKYVSLMKKESEPTFEKCEIILNWSILIAGQLQKVFLGMLEKEKAGQKVSIFESDNSRLIEEIFQNSIVMISSFSKHKKTAIKDKLKEFNGEIISVFQFMNQMISESQSSKATRYKKILEYSLLEMSTADDQIIEFLIEWNEQIFQAIKENYIEHIEKMIKVLDNKNEHINNHVIKFISNIIRQLNNPVLTKKIFCYFLQNNNTSETNMGGFLKFLKILFRQFPNLPLFMSLIKEVSLLPDKSVFSKVVQSFNIFVTFEENFSFIRELFGKIRNSTANESEKDNFKQIVAFWCHDHVSLFSLFVMAGKYQMAYKVIRHFSKTCATEKQLLQLTMIVKMLELPYSSQIRIDLLDYEELIKKKLLSGQEFSNCNYDFTSK